MGTGSFPGVKSGRGVALTTHPLLVPWLRKSRAKPLLPIWAVRPVQSLSACTRVHLTFTYTSTPPVDSTACTEPQCLYKGAPYLYLYLYSPCGQYGLYRVSVPVQGCALSLPFTNLRPGRSEVRNPATQLLQNVQTGSVAHRASQSKGSRVILQG